MSGASKSTTLVARHRFDRGHRIKLFRADGTWEWRGPAEQWQHHQVRFAQDIARAVIEGEPEWVRAELWEVDLGRQPVRCTDVFERAAEEAP